MRILLDVVLLVPMELPLPSIRRATFADAPTIAALHLASWRVAYRGEIPDAVLDHYDVGERVAMWQRCLADDTQIITQLWEEDGRLLSFCASGPTHDEDQDSTVVWEVYNLHVDPALRGGGMGTQLLRNAQELGRDAGYQELSLWVVVGNLAARRFYEKHGMRADGAQRAHPALGETQLNVMRYRMSL